MLNLERLFKIQFDSSKISDDNFRKFAFDHLQKLKVNNTSGEFDGMIKETSIVYDKFMTTTSSEHNKQAVQKAKTLEVNNIMEEFKKLVRRKEGYIRSVFGKDSPYYLEFFPRGVSEYSMATKSNIIRLMDTFVESGKKYAKSLGEQFAIEFDNVRKRYINARTLQVEQMGMVEMEKSLNEDCRQKLERQLNKNLYTLAIMFMGDPERGMDFFNQSIIRPNHASNGNGAYVITLKTDQREFKTVKLTFKSNEEGVLNIKWGNGSESMVILSDSTKSVSHTYVTNGIYNIEITGDTDILTFLGCPDAGLVEVTIPEELNELVNIRLQGNDLSESSVNSVIENVNTTNNINGNLFLNDGTNAPPGSSVNDALNRLEENGWMVKINV